MARKHYFVPESKHLRKFLESNGFDSNGIKTTYKRVKLEVRIEEKQIRLINHAKKQQVTLRGVIGAGYLIGFIKTGILPFPILVIPLNE